MPAASPFIVRKAAVLGAGVMGAQIAAHLVNANVAALESPYVGEINIGTGVETDVVTLFQSLRHGAGSKLAASHGPAKIGEQRRSCLAAQRAADIFGWRPQVSLREGLERTLAYYRGNVAS